jgi:antitoxin MazE
MQVARWGNSLAIRLPKAVVQALDLKEGDDVDIHVEGSRTVAVERTPSREQLVARLRRYRRDFPEGFRFDRLEANERG